MNEDILGLLGVDVKGAKEKAFTRGLLSTIFNAAALSGPQARPVSNVQALGQLGLGAMEAYDTSFDRTLKEALTGMQVKDLIEKRQREKQLQALLPQVFKTTSTPSTEIPTELGATGDLSTFQPVMQPGRVTGVQLDPQKIQALMMIPGGIEAVKGLADTQKLLRQSGLGVGGGEMISPFAPYLTSENPQVRQLAQTYERGFQSGRIDEDTADKRAKDLATMQQSFEARVESAADRRAIAAEGRAERAAAREEKKMEGTESQKAAAGFAERMVNAEGILGQLPSEALPTTGTSLAASVPFVGGYLERQVMSGEQQKFKQAANDWIRAKLRKESGAAIGETEMEQEYATYFPMPGDGPDVIAQKAEARRIATQAMITNAGPVFRTQTVAPRPKDIKSKFNLE
jgi:hypothetical protein